MSIKRTFAFRDDDYTNGMLTIIAKKRNCSKTDVLESFLDDYMPKDKVLNGIAKELARGKVTIASKLADVCSIFAGGVGGNSKYNNGDELYDIILKYIMEEDRIITGREKDFPFFLEKCRALDGELYREKEAHIFPKIASIKSGENDVVSEYMISDVLDAIRMNWEELKDHTYTYRILFSICKISDENQSRIKKTDEWADKYDFLADLKKLEEKWK